MGYIGRGPVKSGAFRIIDDLSTGGSGFNASRTAFTLQHNSSNITPGTEQNLLIAIDGVMQEPQSAFTISGSTITFTSAPASGASFWGVELGDVGGIAQTIANGTVDTSQLVADAVTNAELANMAANTVKVNATTSSANPTDISMASANLSGAIADDDVLLLYDASTTSVKTVAKSVLVDGIGGTNVFTAKATGGIIESHVLSGTTYVIHTFFSSGTFTPTSSFNIDYLVIAGGGGGGGQGGGGGAGGYRASWLSEVSGGGGSSESVLAVTVRDYTITVGAGGRGGYFSAGPTYNAATIGGVSSIVGSDITDVTTVGGGRGGDDGDATTSNRNGGSGGGGGWGKTGGSATSNQGYAGGTGSAQSNAHQGAGGGGAGSVGVAGETTGYGGNGGSGVASTITGTSVVRAGGGGGSSNGSYAAGNGGSGGGGEGIYGDEANGLRNRSNGDTNTGSGGGSSHGWYVQAESGTGGSGIVIIRYAV